MFAAFKNHLQTKEIAALLVKQDGVLRSFSEFKREALKLSQGYNVRWLQTEYNTAVRSARMAANWIRFQENKHLYPNIEYMPSLSASPRDSHKKLWGTIRPIDDPFWDIHMPPGDWNCKCWVRPVKTPPTPVPGDAPAINPVFQNNPGKTAEFINIDETAYYRSTDPDLRDEITRTAVKFGREDDVVRHKGVKGGFLDIPVNLKQNSSEVKKNIEAYTILANKGYKYRLLNVINETGRKNPDALNLSEQIFSDAKVPVTDNIVNALQNNIASANRQHAAEVVIRLKKRYGTDDLKQGLRNSFMNGRNKKIKTVILIFIDDVIERIDVETLRKSI